MSLFDFPFPPKVSEIYDEKLANQLANTQGAISGLNQLTRILPNPKLLMRPILGKEAESSSQLEGTQASVEDVHKIDVMEQTMEKRDEAKEILNYENAMYSGLDMLNTMNLNKMVVREVHKVLLTGARGTNKHPGEFRKGDVWIGQKGTKIGDARYIPPDASQVEPLIEEMLSFINNSGNTHPLIVSAILHHRFEAIHPFEDGNGRTGRLLISMYLIKNNLLKLPVLYPSGFFEKNKERYIEALSNVDKYQKWYEWILFFLEGLEKQANLALNAGLEIDNLFKSTKDVIRKNKANMNLVDVLEFMFVKYFVTAPLVHKSINIPLTTCQRYLESMSELGIIEDLEIHNRQRVYGNLKLLDILRKI